MNIEKLETKLLQICRELGIAAVAYSSHGRGMLTGQYESLEGFDVTDFRRSISRFPKDCFFENLRLVAILKGIAARKGCTSGQLSLACLISRGEDIFSISGTKKIKHLEANMGALSVDLTVEGNVEIRKAVESAEVHGFREAETLMGGLSKGTPPLPTNR